MLVRSRELFNLCKFSTSSKSLKSGPTDLKGRKKGAQEWLVRQMKDPYVEKAKKENYRCRSAFKLIEMDDRFKFLGPGKSVVDCGAAPGSWTQVAVHRCNADQSDPTKPVGSVIAIDLLRIFPIAGATIISNADFTSPEAQKRISESLKGEGVDIFLSDMAPSATGVPTLDHDRIIQLSLHSLRFSVLFSKVGGTFVTKIWEGGSTPDLVQEVERFYNFVKFVKPPASRSDSAELYIIGQQFKGLSK